MRVSMQWVNLLAMVLQLFVVGRLVKLFGIRAGLLWLADHRAGNLLRGLCAAGLMVVRIGKTLENASDYSINNTRSQHALPAHLAGHQVQGEAGGRQLLSAGGDVAAALVVFVGSTFLNLGVRGFALINFCHRLAGSSSSAASFVSTRRSRPATGPSSPVKRQRSLRPEPCGAASPPLQIAPPGSPDSGRQPVRPLAAVAVWSFAQRGRHALSSPFQRRDGQGPRGRGPSPPVDE